MGARDVQLEQSLQARQEFSLIARLEQAQLLEIPEEEFNRLVRELETSSLFKELRREHRLIRFQRYAGTDISAGFFQLKDELAADPGSPDVESLLVDKEDLVGRIQAIGLENFKRYFLYPEPDMPDEDIAQECGLDLSEVQRINGLVDEVSIIAEFHTASAHSVEPGIRYSKVASIEQGPEGLVIGYLSPWYARGRYSIDYGRLEQLAADGALSNEELGKARRLFRKLELINARKDTVTRILQSVVAKQRLFLESRDPRSLLPFSQKDLAAGIEVAPSSVSRAIRGRSVETPWGEEKPLKDFFPRPRRFKRDLLRQVVESEPELPSDEAIRSRLRDRFGVSISRRSVADLRAELRVAPARKRRGSQAK